MGKKRKVPDELFYMMLAFDSDELPDGAWQGVLTDAVGFYNGKNGTNFDPHDTFLAYIKWCGEQNIDKHSF